MRLLFVSTSLDTGGAEHVLEALATGLRAEHEIEVVSLLPAGAVADRLRAAGFRVHDLAGQGGRRKRALPLVVARLARMLRRERFDVVQSFLFHANAVARAACALARPAPALVASVHIVEAGRPWRQALELLTAPLADRIVCVSGKIRRDLGAERRARFAVIRNGVALPDVPARVDPRRPWLVVGRLHRQKGHDILIDAWRELGASAPRLEIAGRGPLEASLRERARGLPVAFLGERRDVRELLAQAGGFVLASRDEGLPLALLEAMACGLPVVATRVGGIPEAVEDGRHGLLVPAGSPGAIARAVRELTLDEARARSLGTRARERIRAELSEARMVAAYGELYQSLRSGRGGSTT